MARSVPAGWRRRWVPGPLCAPWFVPGGGLCAPPSGHGLWYRFATYGALTSPLSPVRPCRARLPWRVRLWSVRPWLASPGGSGVPSVLFPPLFLPFLAFLFCLLVSGRTGRRTEVCPELPWGFGSSFGLSDSAQVKFGSQGAEFANKKSENSSSSLTSALHKSNNFVGVVAERD